MNGIEENVLDNAPKKTKAKMAWLKNISFFSSSVFATSFWLTPI